jgi:hypothetical protein
MDQTMYKETCPKHMSGVDFPFFEASRHIEI